MQKNAVTDTSSNLGFTKIGLKEVISFQVKWAYFYKGEIIPGRFSSTVIQDRIT